MDVALEAKLKSYTRLGTFLVELPALSTIEGAPCVAQLRRLRGDQYSTYLREQSRLGTAMLQLQKLRAEKAEREKAAAAAGEAVREGMTEDEERNVFSVVSSMRALLQHAVLRLFIDTPETLQVYKVVPSPIGDHAENEVSIDVLERDFGVMTNRLLIKSGLIPDDPFPAVPADHTADAGDAGRSGETVQPTAEPISQGAVG